MREEIKNHLEKELIPFWCKLRDEEYGGYYGYMDVSGQIEKHSVKGCILNSRITWFFSQAYLTLGEEILLEQAKWGYEFLKQYCYDKEFGGVYWSLRYDGTVEDTTKHTYNQAFAIYALSAYYRASGEKESLQLATKLYEIIEEKCRDEEGYLEAFDREFKPESNEKLSENGVMAERTMNTLLHVFEAYTEFYSVTKKEEVKERIEWILNTIAEKIYNPILKRQEVFFDKEYHSLIDLHSYGHDIETAWLLERGLETIQNSVCEKKIRPLIQELTSNIYKTAFNGESIYNECERGIVDTDRVWWVQAEGIVGFLNGWKKEGRQEYYEAAKAIWFYIKTYMIDKELGEWYWLVDDGGKPKKEKPIVDPWKCPYHNGRMCMEVIRRLEES